MKGAHSPAYLLVGQAGSAGLAFISAPLIARTIGVEGRGITASVIAMAFVLPTLLSVGLPQEVRHAATKQLKATTVRAARWWVASSFIPSLLLATILYLTLFATFPPDVRFAAAVAIAAAPINMWWMLDLAELMAEQRFSRVMFMQLANPATLLTGVAFIHFAGSESTALVIYANAAGGMTTLLIGATRRYQPRSRGEDSLASLIRRSSPYGIGASADVVSNRLILITALPLLGAESAGFLSVGMTITSLVLIIAQTISAAHFRAAAISRAPQATTQKAIRESLGLGIVSVAAISLLAPIAVPFIFGQPFAGAVPITIAATLAVIPMTASYVCISMLNALGQGTQAMRAQLFGLAAQLVTFTTIALLGVYGSVLALAIGYTATFVIALRALNLSLAQSIPRWADVMDGCRTLLLRRPEKGI